MTLNVLSATNVTNLTLDRTADAGGTEAVRGNDTRLTDKRNPVLNVVTLTWAAAGSQNDVDLGGDYQFVMINTSGAPGTRTLTGITGGAQGKILVLVPPAGSVNIKETQQSAFSQAAYRFTNAGSANPSTSAGEFLIYYYNTTQNRWVQEAQHFSGDAHGSQGDLIVSAWENVQLLAGFGSPATWAVPYYNGSGWGAALVKANVLGLDEDTGNNTSTAQHGFAPKLDNDATHFLNGQGGWTAPGIGTDGWIAGETWTYASATTFTVSGDVSAKYFAGVKSKLTQTTVKYFAVVSSSYAAPNTTVTIFSPAADTFANAAVSNNYYSHAVYPQGWTASPSGLYPWGVYIGTAPFSANCTPYATSVERNIYLTKWSQTFYVETTNNGTNYWTFNIYAQPGNVQVATFNSSAVSANTWVQIVTTSFSVDPILLATYTQLYVYCAKTLSPGNLYIAGPALYYL